MSILATFKTRILWMRTRIRRMRQTWRTQNIQRTRRILRIRWTRRIRRISILIRISIA